MAILTIVTLVITRPGSLVDWCISWDLDLKFLFFILILIGLIGDYDNPQHLDNKLGQGKPAGYYLLMLLVNIAIKLNLFPFGLVWDLFILGVI